jgi:NAD(P)-dependent dehydrogenase (short-subunit alcohol dehydrogenase family)
MEMHMNSKNIFITGAASGIGLAAAKHFLQQGYRVALADLNLSTLTETTSQWDHTHISLYKLDVCSYIQVQEAVSDFCSKHNNCLSVLLNSAGILSIGEFESISNEQHLRTINVNVSGVINMCQAALPYLKNNNLSTIVNMSSASSDYGVPELASYSASKSAVKSLTEALELEWAQYGIRVCDVLPPFVATNMLSSQQKTAKVMSRLGNHLAVEDVIDVIEKQISRPKTHRTVGLKYGILHALSSVSPASLNRLVMQMLTR